MRKFDATVLAMSLLNQHGLTAQGWKVDWNGRKRGFGLCIYQKKLIQLSEVLVDLNPESEVRETVMHEIAHALTPVQWKQYQSGKKRGRWYHEGHGDAWKETCLRIGANPTRTCNNAIVPAGQYKYTCGCPSGISTHRRLKNAYASVCRKCRWYLGEPGTQWQASPVTPAEKARRSAVYRRVKAANRAAVNEIRIF
jgi:predicted SprT family Zn-dependent metalloprotease